MGEERRKDLQGFVTKEVCEIKEKNFESILERIELSVSKIEGLVSGVDEKHRLTEIDIYSKLEGLPAKQISTQTELSEHKIDNTHLNATTISIGITLVSGICGVIIFIIKEVFAK